MIRRRSRAPRASGLFAVERPPRLVLRFAVVLSLALGLASVVIVLVVHHFAVTQGERAAMRHAGLIASTLLQREVRADDLTGVVSPERRRELDAIFAALSVSDEMLGISLVRSDGLVTYSTEHRLIGARDSGALASEAAAGMVVSRTTSSDVPGAAAGEKVLQTYAPVLPGRAEGAAAIVQSYEPIAAAARAAQLRVGGVLEALLVALLVVLVPLLWRVTNKIKRQIEQIHFHAYFDELTGLPNRAQLSERLTAALRRASGEDRRLAVLLLDLDRFREVNHTLGHEAGDELLRQTGARLTAEVGEHMLLARPAGDEFALVAEIGADEDASGIAERIRKAVDRPAVVGGVQLVVEGSVGVALHPEDGADAETLLKHAEVALHTAKEWRVGVLSYSPAVDPHDPEQLNLVGELREAIERGELVLHYQPKIAMTTGDVIGFESLTYWQHPRRGLLPPGAFIPVAERTGAIRHLSRAVLSESLKQLGEWRGRGMKVSMAVNLSAVDLLDLDLPGELDELIGEHGVDPLHVCLEITESTIMTDPERSQAVLNRLAEIGVRLAIDDFGTGHSSLSYIKNLPVHEVKIDKSFVIGMAGSRHERTIVRATIDLAHALGLEVVAEGVETKEAHDTLAGWGCDMAQGYLYGRPQPATAFALPRREPDHVEAEPVDAQARNGEPARLAAGFPLLAHRDAAR